MYRIIDVHTSFGKRVDNDPRFTAATLGMELDRHRIAAALTFSQQGIAYDPRAGNNETIALTSRDPRFVPLAVINLRDHPGWEQELNRTITAGIRGLRMCPGAHNYPLESATFQRLVALLGRIQIPLLISSLDCMTGWELPERAARLTADAGFPLILLDTYYGNMSEVMEVMRRYPHVYAETDGLATVDAVGIMAETVGADHLLYGSAAPIHPMQKSLNQVLETSLSDKQKAAILGGNAMRLFGIRESNLQGRPFLESLEPVHFNQPVIDVHSHLGYWHLPCRDEDYDPVPMLERMRRLGITHSMVSSYESMRYDIAAGNRKVMDAIHGHPELHGYVEIDPWHLDLSCAEMDRYYDRPNVAGCEMELTHIPCPTGSPQVRALMREVARRGKPILFMAASANDAAIERELALEHPNLSIIHAHGASPDWCRTVKDAPNLYVEYCYSRPSHHNLREAIDILGPARVVFGSDQTLLSPFGQVGLYRDAVQTDAEAVPILNGNARRIFGL
ncbi:MAG: hypothetical protein A2340_02750 [Lentisphaerae bacterium RIFOXYB12_FULL_60_10]|nr:MAG: hypothetical protein A2269_05455 [Lentisphaerae bacterium RIFOXYA12_FULL_60_10]OGV84229.1 MAG: hypothetical protein A2340_02750 [Lentisphaerae bacterium RIFOXYB12_FULL_60_10]